MNKKCFFRPTLVALAVSVLCANAQASMVRNDVDYQYFRDFAENKGKFGVGATNVPIFNKQGQYIGTVLPNVPMMDFSPVSRRDGVATLYHPQYITSVSHNTGYGTVQFGADGNNPDNHYFNYLIVDRNNHSKFDIHAPRLHKLVTEVAPIPLNKPDLNSNGQPKDDFFMDKARYPYFVRVGSGRQLLRDDKGQNTQIAAAYQYLTAGTPMAPTGSRDNWAVFGSNIFDEPLSTYPLPGDSGSPLFAYDAKEKRWTLAGVLHAFYDFNTARNTYTVAQPDFMEQSIKDDEIDFNVQESENFWRKRSDNQSARLKLYNENLISQDTDSERPSLAHGTTVHFRGKENSNLTLQSTIHQGAGALYFNNNMTVKAENNDDTWQGAGIVVNGNKTVNWGVKNPEGDRLSKLGTGTLYVNGQGKNLGDISVGDGTVVLDQKALNGEQQAFNQVGITSGRGTVVLANANQVNPDNIYFGFRGGRLDLNGNALTFNYIQNADDGAQIVNHNKNQTASLTVEGQKPLKAEEVKWGAWSKHPETAFTVYEYINTHRGNRLDYFHLKDGGNPSAYFPLDKDSSSDWEFLGNDKTAAVQKVLNEQNTLRSTTTFSGFLGENDRNRHNGALNVTFRPTNTQDSWLLTGGANINGKLNVEKGNVLLSGIPTPHAYDHINKTEVIKSDDWVDRQFIASEFNVSGNASLNSGRNVSRLEGNFNAHQQGQFNLGFVRGESAECIRSTYYGKTTCTANATLSDSVFNQLPTTGIYGNVNLQDQSQFNLGKAHLVGRVQAANTTQMNLKPHSQWTMTGSSEVGNLSLSPNSQVTLNSQYDSVNSNHQGRLEFNQLKINGQLTGNGYFRFLTNLAEQRGDNIVVNGKASGAFLLSVKNTGKEPSSSSPLGLVKLNNPNQGHGEAQFSLENGYADLGAYRYVLTNRNNEYRLYNPLKDAEQGSKITGEMLAASKREFNSVTEQLEAKKQELERLSAQYTQEKAKETASNKEASRLSAEIRKETANQNTIQREINRSRMNPAKHQQLQQQLADSKAKLDNLRKELTASNNNVQSSRKQMQQITRLQNEAKTFVRNFTAKQTQLQRKLSPMESSYADKIAKAQQLCIAEGISSELCRKVANIANNDSTSAVGNELNNAIAQVESAQQALARAEQENNAEAIAYAKQRLDTASTNLLNSLENAYSTLGEVEQFLATQSSNAAMPAQAALISRYANTAVSELSANVNAALQIGRNLDRTLLDQNRANVWANTESTKQSYRSDYYRPYKQTLTLNQIGVAHDVNERVQVGAVLSHSRGNNSFDENVSGKNRLTSVNAFVKGNWENGIFASLDVGYGRSRNTLNFDGQENTFRRHIFSAGANAGVRWDWGVNVQPSVGVRYYRLSGANYALAEAQVESKTLNLTTYRAGLALDKTFDLGGVELKPSLASYYYDASQRKLAVNGALAVNNIDLNQQFGRYFNHEVGLSAGFNQWQISTHLGMLKGSDVAPQKYAAFKLGYTW